VVVEMLNDHVAAGDAGDGRQAWMLPSLAFGGEAWAVLRVRVPEGHGGGRVLSASVGYSTVDGEAGRLAARDEMSACSVEPGASYLRKKVRQGKGEGSKGPR
jgi:hypothetical protein